MKIFESPDKGVTIYYRTPGNLERMRLDSTGNLSIGTNTSKTAVDVFNEWHSILESAENNTAVKKALDQLKTTYYLSKDHGGKT